MTTYRAAPKTPATGPKENVAGHVQWFSLQAPCGLCALKPPTKPFFLSHCWRADDCKAAKPKLSIANLKEAKGWEDANHLEVFTLFYFKAVAQQSTVNGCTTSRCIAGGGGVAQNGRGHLGSGMGWMGRGHKTTHFGRGRSSWTCIVYNI